MRLARLLPLVPLLPLLACAAHLSAAQRQAALQSSLSSIDPNAEPLPPQLPPADGHPAFNTEYYLGSKESEAERFLEFGREIQAIQHQAATDNHQPIQRGFHAKSHGCLHGELHLDPARPPRARRGVFADDSAHLPVWVRYSNGVGWRQTDDTLDARGMAVKVMQVQGKKYLDDEKLTQDFLMTNSPTPVGENAEEFMKFAHANVNGRIAGIFFLLGHPVTAGPALTSTNPIDSSVTSEYWSGGAYHLGANQAIKYMAKPCEGTPARHPSRKDPDYLKADLADAAKGGVCYTFYVQFQVDPEETPIENASKRWDEELSVPVAVGNIVMPPQAVTTGEFCDGLAFNPWHAIAAHAPMGHINRARRIVYSWSQDLRHRAAEPTPWLDPTAVPTPPVAPVTPVAPAASAPEPPPAAVTPPAPTPPG